MSLRRVWNGLEQGIERNSRRRSALIMATLGGLFFLRMIGQGLVTYTGADWLPAIEHWQLGLLPYPVLLGFQLIILIVMGMMVADVWRGQGRFMRPRPRLGRAVRVAGLIYLTAVLVRYAVTMALWPEWRWFGHGIPTVFHGVLAMYLLVYSVVLIDREISTPTWSWLSGGGRHGAAGRYLIVRDGVR